MHILAVGHTYVTDVGRGKWRALAQLPETKVTLVIPSWWPGHWQRLDAASRRPDDGFTLIRLKSWFTGYETRYVLRGLSPVIRASRPDVIHVEDGLAALTLTQALMTRRWLTPQAKVGFFTWINWSVPYGLPRRCLIAHNARAVDYAVAGNRDAEHILRTQRVSQPIQIIPQLGTDPQLFHPFDASDLRDRLKLKGFVVGYAGRFIREKGIHILLQAVVQLADHVTLLLVGGGDYEPDLAALANRLGIQERVRFVEAVPHAHMPDYFNCMDALVLPSLTTTQWREQFGQVLAQSMACQVPVIGSSSAEIPHVVGDAGLVVPEGNSDALRDAIARLMDDVALRERLSQLGRQRVLAYYSDERIAARMRDFFEQVVA
jgi:glycosyltransferase involved in cell wall biosynthesis